MRNLAYNANPEWLYSGDMNAAYGGIWIRHYGDYADAVRIVDLDSAIGFDGAVLIERCSVSLPRKVSEKKQRIKSALSCYGQTVATLGQMSREARRAHIWNAMIDYGYGDSDPIETLQLDPDGPMQFDGWRADRKQPGGDIGNYVMAKYLD